MEHSLVQKLLSRIPAVNIPNNPRNIKKGKPKLNYMHVSTKVVTYKDAQNVEHEAVVGITYTKPKE